MAYYVGKDVDKVALNHYGIIGMKWGVRRFQNKDGTYTPEGLAQRRQAVSSAKENLTNAKNIVDQKTDGRLSDPNMWKDRLNSAGYSGKRIIKKTDYVTGKVRAEHSKELTKALKTMNKAAKKANKLKAGDKEIESFNNAKKKYYESVKFFADDLMVSSVNYVTAKTNKKLNTEAMAYVASALSQNPILSELFS